MENQLDCYLVLVNSLSVKRKRKIDAKSFLNQRTKLLLLLKTQKSFSKLKFQSQQSQRRGNIIFVMHKSICCAPDVHISLNSVVLNLWVETALDLK